MTRTKHLKVMVDEDLVGKDIIEALHNIGAIDIKTLFDCGFPQGTKDFKLVAATTEKRRLLLTRNYRDINERRYKPCTHGGIILIDHPRPSAEVVSKRVRAFCKSGKRSLAEGHVTYLKAKGFTVHKLHKEKVEERY